MPLVGARNRTQLADILKAVDVTLSQDDLRRIEAAVPKDAVAGTRYGAEQMKSLDSETHVTMQVLVIGAGVIGLAVARAAAMAGHDVIVAEAADGIGTGISSRNSEVIHAGMYYPTGSLRAQLCPRGNRMLYEFCKTHGVAHRRCGKLIVATNEAERARLEAIHAQGITNGVEGLELIGGNAARDMEPELTCVAALVSPSTGIIDGHAYMLALQGDLEAHGGAIAFETPVEATDADAARLARAFRRRASPGNSRSTRWSIAPACRRRMWRARIEGYPAARIPKTGAGEGQLFRAMPAGRPSRG